MAPSAWSVLVLSAPLLLGLAAAYPHRAYHDEAEAPAPEKSVRHIDGLDVTDAQRQLEEQVRRQVEEQVRATGSGSASGQWSVRKVSQYSSDGTGGGGGSLAPIRASITGEVLDGTGDGVITTNCHNCRMRVRKVGGGSSLGVGAGGYASGGQYSSGAEQGVVQAEAVQSRYSSSSSRDAGYGGYGPIRGEDSLGGGGAVGSSSRLVQTSHFEQTGGARSAGGYGGSGGYGGFGSRSEAADTASLGGALSTGSSRSQVTTSKQEWNLKDLGYGTLDLQEVIRRMDEDLRAGRFKDGKTVTTVTTTTSENGAPPVTRQETYVQDGANLPTQSVSEGLATDYHQTSSAVIGHSEVEDLLRSLRHELESGQTQAGKTVTTVVESSSVNGAPPVVRKKTYVRDGLDTSAVALDASRIDAGAAGAEYGAPGSRSVTKTTTSVWSSGGSEGGVAAAPLPVMPHGGLRAPGHIDHLGGGNLLAPSPHIHKSSSRNVTTVSSYSTTGGAGHDAHAVDALGGGHLIRESGGYGARRVDSLGGGHLLRETGGYEGSSASAAYDSRRESTSTSSGYGVSAHGAGLKDTRRVDSLGGGHLIRETPLPSTVSVSQMPGYRKEAPADDEGPIFGTGSNSKYYSTFGSSSGFAAGGVSGTSEVADGSRQSVIGDADVALSGRNGGTRTSSSSYKKVVSSYTSSGSADVLAERDVDRLGGGHLIRDVPSRPLPAAAGDVQRTQDLDFIQGEQHNGRIPEAASGSYFSSQQAADGSSYQGGARGGKLTTSLLDIGVLPSGGSGGSSHTSSTRYSATSGYGAIGGGYRASGAGYEAVRGGYGADSGSSRGLAASGGRQYEASVASVPASASSSWSSYSSYSSGAPVRTSYSSSSSSRDGYSYGGSQRGQRMTQHGLGGPDCDGGIKI